jgi:hypothetical protein
MKPDKWGARADYEHELWLEAKRLAHENGECKGAPWCALCLDERCCNKETDH